MLRRATTALLSLGAVALTLASTASAVPASANALAAGNFSTESVVTTAASSSHIQYKIRNGQVKSRGVNLGSWLVAENWMTKQADFWRGVSADDAARGEYTAITKATNPDTIRSNLEYHHSTFITEAEIKAIADAGFNTVRVPVGFWIVGFDNNDPSNKGQWKAYSPNTIKYLDLLIRNWAKKHNIAVLISIHAAKGSQNGMDHSSPEEAGKSYWGQYRENIDNTWSVSTFLAARYKDEEAFLGIALLNEPSGSTDEGVLYQHYQDVYWAIRGTGNDCVLSVAPLLYRQGPGSMNGFMEAPAFKNVWVEWHRYFIWGFENTPEAEITDVAVKAFQTDVSNWNARANHNPLFIGEWCFDVGTKFANDREGYYKWAQAQLNVIKQAGAGWTFWSWRIYGDENGYDGWSLRNLLRNPRMKEMLQAANRP
ncbi:hypothetical protein PybrP1_009342 [[Pythium] brassicae (nom. inval.)]|nr:hypothetical protein PybrP1_009342 [[Pythium] brassicae (nom. inval.)]